MLGIEISERSVSGEGRMVKKLSPTPKALILGASFVYEQEISTG